MYTEIESISKLLHEIKVRLINISFYRDDEGYENDPLYKASELMNNVIDMVDKEVVHSNTFLLLTADGKISRVKIPLGDPSIFNDCVHKLLDCKYYELVSIKQDFYFIVDELGKCYDVPKPINLKASLLYPGNPFGDPIVGTVLIGKHGYVNGEPDAVGLHADDLIYFENLINSIKN